MGCRHEGEKKKKSTTAVRYRGEGAAAGVKQREGNIRKGVSDHIRVPSLLLSQTGSLPLYSAGDRPNKNKSNEGYKCSFDMLYGTNIYLPTCSTLSTPNVAGKLSMKSVSPMSTIGLAEVDRTVN